MSFVTTDCERRARKSHECSLCGQAIRIGDLYISRSGAGNDGFWNLKMHPECRDATKNWGLDEWETYDPGGEERPRTCKSVRLVFSGTEEQPIEYMDVKEWNTGTVEISSNLKTTDPNSQRPGGKIRDIAWDACIDGIESSIMTFVILFHLDINSPAFKAAVEQAVNSAVNNYGSE